MISCWWTHLRHQIFTINKTAVRATVELSTIVTKGPLMSTLLKNQKYKKALGLGQKLAALISEGDMTEFKRKVLVLENLLITGKQL